MSGAPTESGGEGTWARLRRRKVVQWGIAYVAAAWGLLQGLQYFSETFHWPDQIRPLTTLVLIVGLPIVLVLAWYHGDRGEQRIKGAEFAILVVLIMLGGGLFRYYQRMIPAASPKAVASALPADRSIAVLPFVNMSGDAGQEYFADGTSEELNLLAQVPELRVIARTSSFSFKGRDADIATIARTLNVANVLEGSVRKSGDRIRISAQLIRASDSSHLWSQTYDRKLVDVFAVQDEIAAHVVEQLKVKLLGNSPRATATDPRALALFLQAREVARQFNPDATLTAISKYRRALDIDPSYAPAWDGLGYTYFNQMDLGDVRVDQGAVLARAALERAVASDPRYAPAYAHLALLDGSVAMDLAAAARNIGRGLALDPVNLEVISAAAMIARLLGRYDQSIALARYLISRDPINERGHDRLAMAYLAAGRLHEALTGFRTVLTLSPGFASEHMYVGRVLLLQGDAEAALVETQKEQMESWRLVGLAMVNHTLGRHAASDAALEQLITKYGELQVTEVAYAMAWRGENDRVFKWLESADLRNFGVGILSPHAGFTNLHADPRWIPLLRKLGRAPDQLAGIKFDVDIPN